MSRSKSTLVWSLALIAALGGLLFGYDTAVISGALGAIDHNFVQPRGLTQTARKPAMLFSGVLFAVGMASMISPRYTAGVMSRGPGGVGAAG